MSTAADLRTSGPNSNVVQLARRIQELSTLPQVALEVMRVADNPNATAADLKAVMELDAALSARVLRSVNSSAYALRTKVTNLQQAITYLGLKHIRNLAMTASVSRLFRQETTIGPYRRLNLWRHLVAVGICGRLLALRLKLANFEDIFLAGLLHDLGIILEDQYVHPQFSAAMQALEQGATLCEVERSRLGFDHTLLGFHVAENWNFPDLVRNAIRHHHRSLDADAEHRTSVQCVELANLICSCKGMSSVGVNLVKISPEVIRELGVGRQDLTVLASDLDEEIRRNSVLFENGGAA